MSKLAKFFITCAAVFVVGLVMLIAGIATGGVEGLEKVSEDHHWVSTGTGARATVDISGQKFDSIETIGYVDVVVVGPKYYDTIVGEYDVEDIAEPKAGYVLAIFGNNLEAPEMAVKNNTLQITAPEFEFDGINLDFSSEAYYPTVLVFCPDKELAQVKVNSSACDVFLYGVTCKDVDVRINSGDIHADDIVTKGMIIESDAGDIEMMGDFKGTTKIQTSSGDVQLDTKAALKEYSMKVTAASGDIVIDDEEIEGNNDEEGYRYTQDGGKDTLLIKVDSGDIKIRQYEDPDTISL